MELGWLILYVPDVTASVEFYERAFGLQRRFVHESGTFAELETGATALAFAHESLAEANTGGSGVRPNRAADERPAGIEVALRCDDVPAAVERAVAAGATLLTGPETKPWGQVVAWLRDRDGVLVELGTPT